MLHAKNTRLFLTIPLVCLLSVLSNAAQAADLRGKLHGLNGAVIEVACGNFQRHATISASGSYHITDLPANQSCYFSVSFGNAASVRIPFNTKQNVTDYNGSLRKIGNKIIVVRR